MLIKDITFTLKDGRTATLRNAQIEDALDLVQYLEKTAAETEFLMRCPEECDKYNVIYEKEYIREQNASENTLMLVCDVDGKIAGNCHISFQTYIKTKHRASVGIALLKEFWNLGIGTQMFKVMIDVAKQRTETTQIELSFIEGNDRAKALYEKVGFEVIGYIPNGIKQKDGRTLRLYNMIKEIHR